MNKKRITKGRPAVREASRILNHSQRFIVVAEDEEGKVRLHCSGYPHESLVAKELMIVAVGLMKKHKQEVDEMKSAAADLSLAEGPMPADPASGAGQPVGYGGLVLPSGVEVPEKFGGSA